MQNFMQNVAQNDMLRSSPGHSTQSAGVSSLQQPRSKEMLLTALSKESRSKSSLISRNVTISGHRTSVRLEPEMWNGLAEICRRECANVHEVCTVVSGHKPQESSLTAAIRVFVMAYFRSAATEDGHNRSGHGPGGQMMATMLQKTTKK